MSMTLEELIRDIGGVEHVDGDASRQILDLTDDSRLVKPGWAFVARRGTGHDADKFLAHAVEAGASAVIVDQPTWTRLNQAQGDAHLPAGASPITTGTSGAPGTSKGSGDSASSRGSGASGGGVTWVVAQRVDQAWAGALAERFFGDPAKRLRVVGVTGTNGKTTTAFLVQHLLNRAGCKCGLLSTVINDDGRSRSPSTLTTLGAIEFSRWLAAMVANGCQAAVAEVSSHALDQGRTDAVPFNVAVFTNLTGDHLDYHGDLDRYAAAKARLFDRLAPDAWAVVNAEDPYSQVMLQRCGAIAMLCRLRAPSAPGVLDERLVDGSINDAALLEKTRRIDCCGTVLALSSAGSRATLDGPWGSLEVNLPLVGRHNVFNALQAVAAANAVAATEYNLHAGLTSFPGVPGRLERVSAASAPDNGPAIFPRISPTISPGTLPGVPAVPGATPGGAGPAVFVDYAHTHDALQNALSALRPLAQGRLVVVFGCGGDRDRTKRPKMANVACLLADRVVVTSDNPRSEEPTAIIEEILAGVPAEARQKVCVEVDRAAAIGRAIREANDSDTVLIAGKGHEDYQIIGTQKRPFDDRLYAGAALKARGC